MAKRVQPSNRNIFFYMNKACDFFTYLIHANTIWIQCCIPIWSAGALMGGSLFLRGAEAVCPFHSLCIEVVKGFCVYCGGFFWYRQSVFPPFLFIDRIDANPL